MTNITYFSSIIRDYSISSSDRENLEESEANLVHENLERSKEISRRNRLFSSVIRNVFLPLVGVVPVKEKNSVSSSSLKIESHNSLVQEAEEEEEIDFGLSPNSRSNTSSSSNDVYDELISVGWPAWLAAYAGDAIEGWTPRWDDSFEILKKRWQGKCSEVHKARDIWTGKIVSLEMVRFVVEPEYVEYLGEKILDLRKLDHYNMAKLEGLVLISGSACSFYLVFEYKEHDFVGKIESHGFYSRWIR